MSPSITETERRAQELGQRLVERHVLLRQNAAVEAYKARESRDGILYPFLEEVENYWQDKCPKCGETLPHESYAAPEGSEYCYGCPHCAHEFDDADSETAEVYEWWAVTEWLADRLREQGEVLYESGDAWIWGRQTTGQAILLDGVVQTIAQATWGDEG